MILEEIINKIEETFPRLVAEDGETQLGVEGYCLGLGRDAREELRSIIDGLRELAGKEGTFRVMRVIDGRAAAQLVGLAEADWLYVEDALLDLDFVAPPDIKDPTEEYGPAFSILFKEAK